MSSRHARALFVALTAVVAQHTLHAHSGPPFPIVTDALRGPYTISIWTDPDATDDGTAGGQFWIVIAPSAKGITLPADTRAAVSVWPTSPVSSTPATTATTEPVRGDVANQFGTVVMNHEGPFAVHVEVSGPLGQVSLDSMVDATYDLRPAPYMLVLYLMPFLLAGTLWTRLLLRRRSVKAGGRGPSDRVHEP